MIKYFLGIDVGGTKTRALIADETGQAVGFGLSGPGNHEGVGYDGLSRVMRIAFKQAADSAGIKPAQIAGAGFGIGGYDWPSEREPHLKAIGVLGLMAPVEIVNDAVLALLAGTGDGWGVAVVSGTGCNCWGWDRTRQHIGHVTGHGFEMGEGAGASELIIKAMQAVSYEWTRRGPATQLTAAFLRRTGARDLADLLEGVLQHKYELDSEAAPLVFQVAEAGDAVANEVIHWAGCELGEMATAVIRQLGFEKLDFDVILTGSMFDGGPRLIEPMRQTVHALAPGARLLRLAVPPVIGAVLLGMEQAKIKISADIRRKLSETSSLMQNHG